MTNMTSQSQPVLPETGIGSAANTAAYWFRYEDERGESDYGYEKPPTICLRKYRVVSETRKTVLLEKPGMDWSSGRPKPLTRRVLKVARKRFAYPTEDLAMQSFRIRKRRQLEWLTFSIDHVKAVLALLDESPLSRPQSPADGSQVEPSTAGYVPTNNSSGDA